MDYLQLCHYVQQLALQVHMQNDKIKKLEQGMNQLRQQLKEIEENPKTNIEKIEYKFDQLKIETLEGTLNIGLNPTQPENIDDFTVSSMIPQGAVDPLAGSSSPRTIPADIAQEIHSKMNEELDENGYTIISEILAERNMQIADPYYEFIMEDIKKQLEQRVAFHLQQMEPQQLEAHRDEVIANVIIKLQEEVKKGIHAFLTYLPDSLKKGDG
ncbi:spore germination protein GerPC [Priestia abyssalis]|uniref:spore germination protein GerPC n=1 Tax=Priestia abyssalis TaxID=1221450 RepID=UPI0014747B10|nr:spore germination protein GerPC [Priestia abyssalis]